MQEIWYVVYHQKQAISSIAQPGNRDLEKINV